MNIGSGNGLVLSQPCATIGSDIDLSPVQLYAIIWTNSYLLIVNGTTRTKFSVIQIKIQQFSLKKIDLKMLSAKRRPSSCLSWHDCNQIPKFLHNHSDAFV